MNDWVSWESVEEEVKAALARAHSKAADAAVSANANKIIFSILVFQKRFLKPRPALSLK